MKPEIQKQIAPEVENRDSPYQEFGVGLCLEAAQARSTSPGEAIGMACMRCFT